MILMERQWVQYLYRRMTVRTLWMFSLQRPKVVSKRERKDKRCVILIEKFEKNKTCFFHFFSCFLAHVNQQSVTRPIFIMVKIDLGYGVWKLLLVVGVFYSSVHLGKYNNATEHLQGIFLLICLFLV